MWDKDELTRRRLLLAVRVAVSAGAIAWVATRVDPADALGAFRRAPAWVFAVPPVLMLANSTLHALRLKLLLEALDARIPLRKALAALLKASFLGLVLPSGGSDVAKAGFLGEEAGLEEGMRLIAYRNDRFIGYLRVEEVSTREAACSFTRKIIEPKAGDSVIDRLE